ncbi:hypothetical protein B0H11DRAFT_1915328 [Mycena galericulata]|nr:hypothetical protein B0H11DRAFT_1915328 [Mycena galericulata]
MQGDPYAGAKMHPLRSLPSSQDSAFSQDSSYPDGNLNLGEFFNPATNLNPDMLSLAMMMNMGNGIHQNRNFGAPPQHSTPNGRGGKQTARNPPQKPQLVVSEQKVSQREKENSKRNTHTKTCGGCGVVPAWGGRFDRWSRWARQMYSQTSIGWVRGEMHEHCAEGQKDVERGVGFILSEMFANIWNRLQHTFCCLWLNFKEWLGRWDGTTLSSSWLLRTDSMMNFRFFE